MKNKLKILSFFLILLFAYSCGNKKAEEKVEKESTGLPESAIRDPKNYFKDCKKLFNYAQSIDSALYAATDMSKAMADKALAAFTDYAYYCGNDSLSPIFLIKAGQVAQASNNSAQAKVVLEKCIHDYPNFKGITAAMFLLAQLYDEKIYLNNEEEARRLYEEILTKYPDSPEAESAKGALRFIGKTDQEIIKILKKEAQEQKQNVTISQ